MVGALWGLARLNGGEGSLINNARVGLAAVVAVLGVLSCKYMPRGTLRVPGWVLAGAVRGLGVAYLCGVVFLCCLSRDQVQFVLREFVDGGLGVPLPEKHYAEDCSMTGESGMKNLEDKMDVFMLGHFIGWFFKMLIVRDWKLCMFQSVMFEVLEVTFRHWLPNFYECWWDQLIVDIMVCNTGGIVAGQLLIKYFEMAPYRWSLRETQRPRETFLTTVRRFLTESDLSGLEWRFLGSLDNFLKVAFFVVFFQLCDLLFFFNKFILWVPHNHFLCGLRVWLVGVLSIPAAAEYYQFITRPRERRLGANNFLLQLIIYAEIILFFRNYDGQFTNPFPAPVLLFWALFAACLLFVLGKLAFHDLTRAALGRKAVQQ